MTADWIRRVSRTPGAPIHERPCVGHYEVVLDAGVTTVAVSADSQDVADLTTDLLGPGQTIETVFDEAARATLEAHRSAGTLSPSTGSLKVNRMALFDALDTE